MSRRTKKHYDIEKVTEYLKTHTIKSAADFFDCSIGSMRQLVRNHKIPTPYSYSHELKEKELQIIKEFERPVRVEEVANKYHYRKTAIYRVLRFYKITPLPCPRPNKVFKSKAQLIDLLKNYSRARIIELYDINPTVLYREIKKYNLKGMYIKEKKKIEDVYTELRKRKNRPLLIAEIKKLKDNGESISKISRILKITTTLVSKLIHENL